MHSTSLNEQKIQDNGVHDKKQYSSQKESSNEYTFMYNDFNDHNAPYIKNQCA